MAQVRTTAANAPAGSRLPSFAKADQLPTQWPDPGPFNSAALGWKLIKDNGAHALVAAIPFERLADFQTGEEDAGSCMLNADRVYKKVTNGLLMNNRAVCSYAGPDHKQQQARQNVDPDLSPQALKQGTRPRKGALQNNTSARIGCQYHFHVKRFAKRPEVVVLKFPCEEGDKAETCASMRHLNKQRQPAHEGADLHLQKHTQEMYDFVLPKLKDHIKPAVICAGALQTSIAQVE